MKFGADEPEPRPYVTKVWGLGERTKDGHWRPTHRTEAVMNAVLSLRRRLPGPVLHPQG